MEKRRTEQGQATRQRQRPLGRSFCWAARAWNAAEQARLSCPCSAPPRPAPPRPAPPCLQPLPAELLPYMRLVHSRTAEELAAVQFGEQVRLPTASALSFCCNPRLLHLLACWGAQEVLLPGRRLVLPAQALVGCHAGAQKDRNALDRRCVAGSQAGAVSAANEGAVLAQLIHHLRQRLGRCGAQALRGCVSTAALPH